LRADVASSALFFSRRRSFPFLSFLLLSSLSFSMRLLSLLFAASFLASCKTVPKAVDPAKPGDASAPATAVAGGMVSAEDVAAVNTYFKTHKTNGMLPAAPVPVITPANSFFVVDLDGQRAYLYTDKKLLAATSIASGRKYYRTETGDYTVGQKDLNHRSSSYGNFVTKGGDTIMGDVQNGFDPTPVGARFEGALMKYFLRFHLNGSPTAMGFHRGILPGYPASHGCVRLPDKMASWFFTHVPLGTPIFVRGTKNGVPYGASQGRPKRSPRVHSSLKNKPNAAKPADPGPESATSSVDASPAAPADSAPADSAPAAPAAPAPAPAPEASAPEPVSTPAGADSPKAAE